MSFERDINPEEKYAQKELIDLALKSLDEREEQVLRLRFFEKMTLEEVAQELGLSTRERVRQIEGKALLKLRRNHTLPEKINKLLEQLKT